MGIRSKVVIALSKEAYMKAEITETLPELFKQTPYKKNDYGVYWIFDSIKWYGDYEEIKGVEIFLNSLEDKDYGLVEVCEDTDANRTQGHAWEYGLYVQHYINHPFD